MLCSFEAIVVKGGNDEEHFGLALGHRDLELIGQYVVRARTGVILHRRDAEVDAQRQAQRRVDVHAERKLVAFVGDSVVDPDMHRGRRIADRDLRRPPVVGGRGDQPAQRRNRPVGLAGKLHAHHRHLGVHLAAVLRRVPEPALIDERLITVGLVTADAQQVEVRAGREHLVHQLAALLVVALVAQQGCSGRRFLRCEVHHQSGLPAAPRPQGERRHQHHHRQEQHRFDLGRAALVTSTGPEGTADHGDCPSACAAARSTSDAVIATGSVGTRSSATTPSSRKAPHARAAAATSLTRSGTTVTAIRPSAM